MRYIFLLIALSGCVRVSRADAPNPWKKLADDPNHGLLKYEDAEVVCYVARGMESVALQCFQKGK